MQGMDVVRWILIITGAGWWFVVVCLIVRLIIEWIWPDRAGRP